MKKHLLSLLIPILLVSVLCGCSSAKSVSMSLKTGFPVWYYNPQVRLKKSQQGFSGSGQGETERQAELIAYTEILSDVSEYLGEDVDREKSREFLTLGKIDEYGLKVTDTFFSQTAAGSFSAAIRATAQSEKLDLFRSEEAKENDRIILKIEELIKNGDKCIMESRDIAGVSYYIESMILSYGKRNIPDEYSFDVIFKEVLDIVGSSRIEITEEDTNGPACTVRVKRKESVFYENIVDCPIKASFMTRNNLGQNYSDSITFNSDRTGKVYFSTLNKAMSKSGKLIFSFNLDSEIKSLSLVSEDAAEVLSEALDEKKQIFVYGKEYSMSSIGVCVYEYDNAAEFYGSEKYTSYLTDLFAGENIGTVPFPVDSELNEDELLAKYNFSHSDSGMLLNVKINPIETIESANEIFAVNVEGLAVLYDASGNVIFDGGLMYATGFGNTIPEAKRNAFERFCQIVCNRIKAVYV